MVRHIGMADNRVIISHCNMAGNSSKLILIQLCHSRKIDCLTSEFFYRILIGTSVVWVAFHEFSFLISLETTLTVTWLKQKLVAPIILLIAMILERFRYFINELVVD